MTELAALSTAAQTASSSSYLDVYTGIALAVGLAVAGLSVIWGLRGRAPDRLLIGATSLLQVVLLAYAGRYLFISIGGEGPVGPVWELWAYLVTIVMLPALGLIWAKDEPTRWGSFVLAVAAFVAAVMCGRAAQIWAGVGMS
ncbi:hypothetical protein [Ornithinimicrobium sp. INDO-MA30-4]|uniref:hypothetical protein n=1 Tax=Ornithinimicrobium sp. INDO-MA30-4 TaxID=2908651 RepID=UPI001F46F304|nr:hypothetical protein [Ornithinimicrobium sp. INDO-MA30-4]UJH71487.1 hypothetical protein L0A91_07340 [Ornithinimicrobium sp. INDO-MA30-4]